MQNSAVKTGFNREIAKAIALVTGEGIIPNRSVDKDPVYKRNVRKAIKLIKETGGRIC